MDREYVCHIKGGPSCGGLTLCQDYWRDDDFRFANLDAAEANEKNPIKIVACKKCLEIAREEAKPKVYAHHSRTKKEQKAWRKDYNKRLKAHEKECKERGPFTVDTMPADLRKRAYALMDEDTELLERLDNWKPDKKFLKKMKKSEPKYYTKVPKWKTKRF